MERSKHDPDTFGSECEPDTGDELGARELASELEGEPEFDSRHYILGGPISLETFKAFYLTDLLALWSALKSMARDEGPLFQFLEFDQFVWLAFRSS